MCYILKIYLTANVWNLGNNTLTKQNAKFGQTSLANCLIMT